MLAGLIRAPSQDNPVRNPDAARERTVTVLDAMAANGKLKQQEADAAKARPAELHQTQVALPSGGSFRGTIRARTTLDPRLQAAAVSAVPSVLDKGGQAKRPPQRPRWPSR